MKQAEFDLFAREYEALHERSLGAFGRYQDRFAEYKIADLADETRRYGLAGASDRVLDFGAGCGKSVPGLAKHFPRASVSCLDVSQDSLDIVARDFPTATRLLSDGRDIPAASSSFDVAFSACVFHHIDHAEHPMHLRELHRVLRSGGLLMIYEHNPFNPMTVRVVNRCEFDRNAVLVTPRALKRRVVAAGFTDVRVRYRLFMPPSWERLRGVERLADRVPLGAQYYVVGRKPSA